MLFVFSRAEPPSSPTPADVLRLGNVPGTWHCARVCAHVKMFMTVPSPWRRLSSTIAAASALPSPCFRVKSVNSSTTTHLQHHRSSPAPPLISSTTTTRLHAHELPPPDYTPASSTTSPLANVAECPLQKHTLIRHLHHATTGIMFASNYRGFCRMTTMCKVGDGACAARALYGGCWRHLTATDPSPAEPRAREHVGCAERHQGPVCDGIGLTHPFSSALTLVLPHPLSVSPTPQDESDKVAAYGIQAATGERALLM